MNIAVLTYTDLQLNMEARNNWRLFKWERFVAYSSTFQPFVFVRTTDRSQNHTFRHDSMNSDHQTKNTLLFDRF